MRARPRWAETTESMWCVGIWIGGAVLRRRVAPHTGRLYWICGSSCYLQYSIEPSAVRVYARCGLGYNVRRIVRTGGRFETDNSIASRSAIANNATDSFHSLLVGTSNKHTPRARRARGRARPRAPAVARPAAHAGGGGRAPWCTGHRAGVSLSGARSGLSCVM